MRCIRIASLVLLLGPVPSLASTAVDALEQLLAPIETLQADVRQVIVQADGSILEESRIRFLLRRPEGFYWETLEPWPELIVTDGQTLWHYQPDLWQLTIDDWQRADSELAAQLLSGRTAALSSDYDVERHPASTEGQQAFLLQPRDPASLYEQVELYFEEETLAAIDVDQANGQRTLWEFSDVVLNEPIPVATFQFRLPDDADRDMIDILDNRDNAP